MAENRWDQFAKTDAESYILTSDTDYATQKGKKAFFQSGDTFTEKSLEKVTHLLPDTSRALEIGCGVGRLTFPHCKTFDEIIAVDVSPTMLDKLNRNASEFGYENIKTFLPSQSWTDYSFNYAYSYLVFQHLRDCEIIENYINNIADSLQPGGIAQLQFDTRHSSLLYRIRNVIPDLLLSKRHRTGMRRIRRSADNIRLIFKKSDFNILEEFRPDSDFHTFILKKDPKT